jgi:hypothetical protein
MALPLFAESTATVQVPHRSPTGALLRSAVIPGWGQFYNSEPLKGLGYGALQAGLLGWVLYENNRADEARENHRLTGDPAWEQAYEEHYNRRRSLIWYTAGAWVLSMLDAYVDAYLFGFEAENRSFDRNAGLALGIVINL